MLLSFANLVDGFCRSCDLYPDRPALEVAGRTVTYAELEQRGAAVGRAILAEEPEPHPLAAFLAYRSLSAYTAVIGILAAGKGYVPLNPNFPAQRTATMLALSGCSVVVLAAEGVEVFRSIAAEIRRELTILCLDVRAIDELRSAFPQHRFIEVPREDERRIDRNRVANVSPDSIAYLLFTSGSTGVPKGVPVSQRNVSSYLNYVVPRYGFSPEDRFSQTFDMTFDLSVNDMFVCWSSGACLVSIPHASVMAPAKIIRDARLTVWFSVPSVVMFMQRLRTLRAGSFPNLRVSLFCGEPLLESWADAWQQAAPNSILENVYGPTEATIAISHYRWNPQREQNSCLNGIVPIGTIFATQKRRIAASDGQPAQPGHAGELWLSGTQVTCGYLNNPEKTAQQFVRVPGEAQTWYRTGDLVLEDEQGVMQYLGRVDHQVQICGHRVELQEIDEAVRKASANDSAIAVAWPLEAGRADSVYAFLCAPDHTDANAIIKQCEAVLPAYMVPKKIFMISEMPVNSNGKIDRAALARRVGDLLHATA